jgi:prepilin signal peptidase PulO-like enzyme (type II secretory pathway)
MVHLACCAELHILCKVILYKFVSLVDNLWHMELPRLGSRNAVSYHGVRVTGKRWTSGACFSLKKCQVLTSQSFLLWKKRATLIRASTHFPYPAFPCCLLSLARVIFWGMKMITSTSRIFQYLFGAHCITDRHLSEYTVCTNLPLTIILCYFSPRKKDTEAQSSYITLARL